MSGDRGAKAAAGRLRTIVDRFFDGLVYISTLRLRFDPKQKRHALWDRAHRSNNFNHAEFPAHCHKRSNVETAFSMIKAKFNGSVGSKTPTVDCQRKWDTRGGRKHREFGGGVSSLDEVERFRERSRDVQTETSEAVAAEERTEAARFFVRRVRTAHPTQVHSLWRLFG